MMKTNCVIKNGKVSVIVGRVDRNGKYFEMGKQVGTFGYSVRKRNHKGKNGGKK